jgi:hypothetical protein
VLKKVRLIQLPSEIIGHMHEDIVKEQDKLKSKLAKLEIQLHRNLVKGNASFYDDARKDCRKFSKKYDDYDDYRKSIYDA